MLVAQREDWFGLELTVIRNTDAPVVWKNDLNLASY